jgi:8-oxo-dGTP pyrophosphatase MutT (NUDIX family)
MYVGAGIILRNAKGQVILVRDARSGRWGFPKGHPEPEDKKNPINTAIRECEEETGLQPLTDYVIDITVAKRIGKRLYFYGICLKEHFDKGAMPVGEISDVRWWSFEELLLNEAILNSDLRCWIKKMRVKMSPSFGPVSGPHISVSTSI